MAHSSSDTAFLTLEKSFNYRGVRERWTNAYHWDQVPQDQGTWDQLAGQVWFLESVFLDSEVQLEVAYGHLPGTPPVLVYEKDEPPAGEGGLTGAYIPQAGEFKAPGDAAAWCRWGTTQKTSLGKTIYLRNYYHQVYVTADGDTLATRYHDGINTLASTLQTGITVNGVTFRRAGPRGAVAQNHATGQFATTRTLKHRGKRKKTQLQGSASDTPVIVDFGSLWKLVTGGGA